MNGTIRTRRLASGEGTVAAFEQLGQFWASVWYFEDDRQELLEEWTTDGTLADRQAVRAMVKGFVDSYAGAN
jgi:hypothetical protein